MDMNTIQEEITSWIKYNFPTEDETVQTYLGMVEEVGELARAVVKRRQGIRGTTEEWNTEIKKELGDVLLKLFDIAQFEGLSLETVLLDRWETIKLRDWQKDKLGHGIEPD